MKASTLWFGALTALVCSVAVSCVVPPARGRYPTAPSGLTFCNHSNATIDTAVAFTDVAGWRAGTSAEWDVPWAYVQGWWTLTPGQCTRVIGSALDGSNEYEVHAHDTSGRVWSGKNEEEYCLPNTAFLYRGDAYWSALRVYDKNTGTFDSKPCPTGMGIYQFGMIDTGQYTSYSNNFGN